MCPAKQSATIAEVGTVGTVSYEHGAATPRTSAADRALRALDRLRPPSSAIRTLLLELDAPFCSFARIERLIRSDATLTTEFLRRANSALHSRKLPVRSVLHALAMMGTERVRRLARRMLSEQAVPNWKMPPHFSRTAYLSHVNSTAALSELIQSRLDTEGDLFLAATLHDVSRLLVAHSLPETYAVLTENGNWDNDREYDLLGMSHAELSAAILERWGLPADTVEAVGNHHDCWEGSGRPPLSAILAAADDYTATMLGPAQSDHVADFGRAIRALGLKGAIPALLAEFHGSAGMSMALLQA